MDNTDNEPDTVLELENNENLVEENEGENSKGAQNQGEDSKDAQNQGEENKTDVETQNEENKDEEIKDEVTNQNDENVESQNESQVSGEKEDEDSRDTRSEEDKIKDEHYSRNKPNEFSSENFKIELGGLPKYYPLSQLKKLLNATLQLDAHRVRPGGMGRNVAYINFKDEESRFKALTILNGYKWQGVVLTAQEADPAKDPILLAKIEYLKVPKKEHELLPLNERIQKAVIPFHGMDYEDQIKEKERVIKNVLRKYGNELSQLNPELRKFVHWHKMRRRGQICELDDMIHSPVKEGYRNKCEFTIGKNKESEKPVVGFRVASYKEGSVEVGPIAHLPHLNDKMKEVVKLMEEFLETSKHEPFDPFSHQGVWRQLTIRTSNNNDVMIIVVIHPQDMEEESLQSIKEDVKKFFTEGNGSEVGITSMYFQQYGQKESGKEIEYEHIYGKTYIEETILGKTFRASPDAFLQVNTPACEVLYEKIAEVADIDATSIVLDVCCGVGTIGLSIAEAAYKMMGVEMTTKAVENARFNSEANDVTNAVFYNGKAEDYIETMIERSQRSNVIAIVDPPRAGLNGSVMNALRKCEYLNKLVYVSCDPQAAINNFQALGRLRSKTYKGSFFVPIRATPVDLFPDTPHFELIIVFERYDECKWDRIMNGNPRPKDQEYFNRIPELPAETEQFQKEREEKRKLKEEERRRERRGRGRGRGGDRWEWGRGRYGDYGGRDNWRDGGWNKGRRNDGYGKRGMDDGWGSGMGGGGGFRGGGGGGGGGGFGGRGGGGGYGGGRGISVVGGDGGGGPLLGNLVGGGAVGLPQGAQAQRRPPQRNFRQDFGEGSEYPTGFQEGFQAGLEAVGNQYPGFGQGGGWNMAETQGEYGPQESEDYSMEGPKGNTETSNWGYGGNKTPIGGHLASGTGTGTGNMGMLNNNTNNYQQDLTNQPVTYPTSVTNPPVGTLGGGASGAQAPVGGAGQYGYQGYQAGYGNSWGQNQNQNQNQAGQGQGQGQAQGQGNNAWSGNQVGDSWSQNQYQSFEEPAAKKWKQQPANPNVGVEFDYSNY